MKLLDIGVDLEQEEDAAGFLGFNLERDEETGQLKMKQPGLIDIVISDVVLDDRVATGNYISSGSIPLVKNEDGVPASDSFNYSSFVGIMIYLYSHTLTDICFAVNFCARYMFFSQAFT